MPLISVDNHQGLTKSVTNQMSGRKKTGRFCNLVIVKFLQISSTVAICNDLYCAIDSGMIKKQIFANQYFVRLKLVKVGKRPII